VKRRNHSWYFSRPFLDKRTDNFRPSVQMGTKFCVPFLDTGEAFEEFRAHRIEGTKPLPSPNELRLQTKFQRTSAFFAFVPSTCPLGSFRCRTDGSRLYKDRFSFADGSSLFGRNCGRLPNVSLFFAKLCDVPVFYTGVRHSHCWEKSAKLLWRAGHGRARFLVRGRRRDYAHRSASLFDQTAVIETYAQL
jgi:hypothetical protein